MNIDYKLYYTMSMTSLYDVLVPGVLDTIARHLDHPSDIRALLTVSKGVSASVPCSPAYLTHLLLSTTRVNASQTSTDMFSVRLLSRALAHRMPPEQCSEIIAVLATCVPFIRCARDDVWAHAERVRSINILTAAKEGLRDAAMSRLGIVPAPSTFVQLNNLREMLSYARVGNEMKQLQSCLQEIVFLMQKRGGDLADASSLPVVDALLQPTLAEQAEKDMLTALIDADELNAAELFATALDNCTVNTRRYPLVLPNVFLSGDERTYTSYMSADDVVRYLGYARRAAHRDEIMSAPIPWALPHLKNSRQFLERMMMQQ